MVNYSNGKIYKIVNSISDKCYIGSTTQPLHKRFHQHKKQSTHNCKKKCSSKILFDEDPDGCEIVLIEKYECSDKHELHARERYYIESLDCVNKRIPTRTYKERYEDNKDIIKEQNKAYKDQNKDRIKEQNKAYKDQNKDRIKEQNKAYYERNKDKLKTNYELNKDKRKAQMKAYYQNNKDKIKEQMKTYNEKNKDKQKAYRKAYYERKKMEQKLNI